PELAGRGAGVVAQGPLDCLLRREPFLERLEAVPAVEGDARRLGGHGADAGLCPRHDVADGEVLRLNGDAHLACARVGRDDRVRHARDATGRRDSTAPPGAHTFTTTLRLSPQPSPWISSRRRDDARNSLRLTRDESRRSTGLFSMSSDGSNRA